MILLSNNLRGKIEFPKNSVVRINSAWIKSIRELEEVIKDNSERDVFLDYPSGRTKPPKPVLDLVDLVAITQEYDNVKYFAVSNAEDKEFLEHIYEMLPNHTELVPKIETLNGVRKIDTIIRSSRCSFVMLDKEDLYLNCGTDTKLYENSMGILKDRCHELGVRVLELKGVVFE